MTSSASILSAARPEPVPAAAPLPGPQAREQAERAILITLQKSGTHLVTELMHGLGYQLYGAARIPPERQPKLDRATRRAVAHLGRSRWQRWLFDATSPVAFKRRTEEAWEALAWSWRERLGLQLINQYDQESVDRLHRRDRAGRLSTTSFDLTPPNICWIFHELDVAKVDGRFLRDWTSTGRPAIIFNYRDPRDVLLSFVNYLAGRTPQGIGNFSHYWSFHRTLASLPDLDAQLSYAIRDPSFPGHDDFRKSLWLLNSPLVCKVAFEDLVGSAGGGSDARQSAAIRRVLDHLGLDADPAAVAARLYRRDSFTFFRGQIGGWREAFSSEHRRAFREVFGDIAEQYGYPAT